MLLDFMGLELSASDYAGAFLITLTPIEWLMISEAISQLTSKRYWTYGNEEPNAAKWDEIEALVADVLDRIMGAINS